MAIASTTIWEARTDGHDDNGGGYNSSRAGATTDYTYPTPQVFVYADISSNGGSLNQLTSVGRPFVNADIGNHIRLTGGTNVITGWYEIISVAAGIATVDRNAFSAAGAADGTGRLGGACSSLANIFSVAVAGNKLWIRATGTYSLASGLNTGAGWSSYEISGYGTTRGDKTKAIIQASAAITFIHARNNGRSRISDLDFDFNGTNSTGIFYANWAGGSNGAVISRCRFRNGGANSLGFYTDVGTVILEFCIAESLTRGFGLTSAGGTGFNCRFCEAISCTIAGFGSSGDRLFCTARGCGIGFSSFAGDGGSIDHCTIRDCTTGISSSDATSRRRSITDCIIYGCTGWGITGTNANEAYVRNCALGANGSGNIDTSKVIDDGGNITLTADPNVNAAAGDLALNNTAGGGAACRAASTTGLMPAGTSTSYLDKGAVQHQDSGGGGSRISQLMSGGNL